MTQEQWSEVDRYFAEHFLPHDRHLEAALSESEAAGLPDIQVSPNQGQLLTLLAAASRAKSILEIGTLGGYSSICLARALPKDGRLITLELEPKHAAVARENINRAGLADKVDIRIGPALDSLSKLGSEKAGPFDLIFIDADKPNIPGYLQWAIKLAHPGSLIIIDNVVRGGNVVDPSAQDAGIQGIRKMVEEIGTNANLRAALVQTVGVKGYDGLAIVQVRESNS